MIIGTAQMKADIAHSPTLKVAIERLVGSHPLHFREKLLIPNETFMGSEQFHDTCHVATSAVDGDDPDEILAAQLETAIREYEIYEGKQGKGRLIDFEIIQRARIICDFTKSMLCGIGVQDISAVDAMGLDISILGLAHDPIHSSDQFPRYILMSADQRKILLEACKQVSEQYGLRDSYAFEPIGYALEEATETLPQKVIRPNPISEAAVLIPAV